MSGDRTYGTKQVELARAILDKVTPINRATMNCYDQTMKVNAWYAKMRAEGDRRNPTYVPTEYSIRWAAAVLAGKPVPMWDEPTPVEGSRTV